MRTRRACARQRGCFSMRVLLADPPARGTRIDDSYPNLGLLYLAGSVKASCDEANVGITYLGPKHNMASHVEFVRDICPDVYAISFTSKAASLAYHTINAVRTACPDALIVAGGAHPTAMPMDVFSESAVDVVGVGEGEVTFVELIKARAGCQEPDLSAIAGILFRRDAEVVETPPRPVIKSIDEVPFPAWELVDFRDYPGMHLKKQPIESSLLISRGCPYQCAFCSQPIWKYSKPWVRARSVDNVCAEIDVLYERGVREIYLSSDELNFNEKWAIDLCEGIASRGYGGLYFQCNIRADKVSKALADALAEMNCWLVHIGIESANDRVLAGIGKRITVAQIEKATKFLSGAGVKVFAFMMLYQAWEDDGKLAWETTEEVENSLRFMRKLFAKRYIHYMSWQFCTPMPGAPLFEIAKRHDLYRGDAQGAWEAFDEHNVCMKLPGISERTMRWKLKKGILTKDWFMLRSGAISWRHLWRVWENVRALAK